MNVKPSPYLTRIHKDLKTIIDELSIHFDYISVLATDTKGKSYGVRTRSMEVRDFMGERGMVFRAVCQGKVAEVSINDLKLDVPLDASQKIIDLFKAQFEQQARFESVLVDLSAEESTTLDVCKSYEIPFDAKTPEEKLKLFSELVKEISAKDERIINTIVQYAEVIVSKLFISSNKDMMQTYPWSQGAIAALGKGESGIKFAFKSVSGMKGLELLEDLRGIIDEAVKNLDDTLKTTPIIPGEYEIICTPDITGLIAHEAFGHGVEMDMFVKNRAQAPQFIDKAVASPLVGMHDGALVYDQVSSYAFDDEGTLAHDTVIIENGILKQGICDALSASRLHTKPTGNGKRETFERKAYTRMTSTYFTSGNDKLDDMIASVKKGYLLDGMESGMEDPKNWGIQCVLSRGYEIIDGKFTGNVVGPIILTGYVIDLLKSITMVSEDVELMGSGFCGKGHKEWVKTANGGAYIKATARLG